MAGILIGAVVGCVISAIFAAWRFRRRRGVILAPTPRYGALDERWIEHAERHSQEMARSMILNAPPAIRSK